MDEAAALHLPVLRQELLQGLRPAPGGLYVDATLGLGGHSLAILQASAPSGQVIGFEWDAEATPLARVRLLSYIKRVRVIEASYVQLRTELAGLGVAAIDGLIADLGVSSLQFDRGERGFSFQVDAPLDMRMDQRLQVNAADLLNRLDETQLADLFYYLGEERQARRIARFLIQARQKEKLFGTKQLAELVAAAVPKKYHPTKTHVATKVFQALRIAVNAELKNLTLLLEAAPYVLKRGARIAIITFHSLEDRLVKQAFRSNPAYKAIFKRPLTASPQELALNPRCRSAKLRVAERT